MARPRRVTLGGYVYHTLNRANGRLEIFKKAGDFEAFEKIIAQGLERFDVRLCGYCIMSNHWHMLLWPQEDGVLSDFMRWITQTHTQRFHVAHGTTGIGHLYQGRFKSFPVQDEAYYLTVLRYIEANPVRAEIVEKADDWPWSSFAIRNGYESVFDLSDGPIDLPSNWNQLVHEHIAERDLDKLNSSIKRGAPLGEPEWRQETACKMGLESSLAPRGRPKKGTEPL